MRIFWTIKGKYCKLTDDGQEIPSISLNTLMTEIQGIAKQQKISHSPTIHQWFGLNFLPQQVVTELVTNLGKSTPTPENLQPRKFTYQFIPEVSSQLAPFNLPPDNPQIPPNLTNICEGSYQEELLQNSNNSLLKEKRENALNELKNIINTQPLVILHHFLQNSEPQTYSVSLCNNCQALLTTQDLPDKLQEAFNTLKNNPFSDSENPLVKAYQRQYLNIMPSFRINTNLSPSTQIKIGKGIHRQLLENLINSAEQFLLISSYRLEDEAIIKAIVNQAPKLPLGVWILTDLSDAVQDIVDLNMEEQNQDNTEYAYSNEQKKLGLELLRKAKIGFRSGYFHFKAYISEKSAYLGSCNLTGGSLARNGEAGIIWQNKPENNSLINYFCYLWKNKTNAQAIPSAFGFQIQSLIHNNSQSNFSSNLLNQYQYQQDLTTSLQYFMRQTQGKIKIYTRNFNPTPQQINLLKYLPCQIYYSNFNNSDLTATKIPHLHSKIVVIGEQVAYLSTQDFAFSNHPLFDITYKTTNKSEILAITQQLNQLH